MTKGIKRILCEKAYNEQHSFLFAFILLDAGVRWEKNWKIAGFIYLRAMDYDWIYSFMHSIY